MLSGKRNYDQFFIDVWPYVVSALSEKVNGNENKIWRHAAANIKLYMERLHGMGICSDISAFKSQYNAVKRGDEQFQFFDSVKKLYSAAIETHGLPCGFVDMLDAKDPTACRAKCGNLRECLLNVGDFCNGGEIYFLVVKIEHILNLYHKLYQLITSKVAGGVKNPDSRRISISLSVFTSHLGRALCYLFAGEDAESKKEIEHSIRHLRRCIMDCYKVMLNYIVNNHVGLSEGNQLIPSHGDREGGVYVLPNDFWKTAIEARVMEHDGGDMMRRIDKYNELIPYINDLIEYLEKL
ncbi:hypothetical protein FACS1894139_02800 [Planctomycetales bacterium]|nr:hypothetical protein FACS1894139_02800 [Planctomycetales bacterium]